MRKREKETRWWVAPLVLYICMALAALVGFHLVSSCSAPKYVERVVVEYRDRVVHDTATVEVPVEVEKVVTRDTISHLENTWAQSDAVVSGGFLHHSLESRPQVIKVPVEVHVTDTLYKASEIVEKTVEVEKPLSWWQSFKIRAFWWLLAAVVLLLLWTFRKFIFK